MVRSSYRNSPNLGQIFLTIPFEKEFHKDGGPALVVVDVGGEGRKAWS